MPTNADKPDKPKGIPISLRGKPRVLKRKGAKPIIVRKVGRDIAIEGLDDFAGFGKETGQAGGDSDGGS